MGLRNFYFSSLLIEKRRKFWLRRYIGSYKTQKSFELQVFWMVRRKCPSTIETKSSRIHRVIQVTRSGEWSYGEKYRLKIQTISDLRVHQFHHWSDFCNRLDEYGTGASKDLSTDSVNSVDDTDQFQKALDKIHKDLMFKNDEEKLCVEVHIDKTGKESHNIIECWKYTSWEPRICFIIVVKNWMYIFELN